MICDFGSFTRRGLLVDLEHPAEILGGRRHITDRAGGDGRRQKDNRLACSERVRGPKTASPREIPMILNALFSTA